MESRERLAELFEELVAAFRALAGDETVRAIVLGARGRAFSTGLDLAWLSTFDADNLASQVWRIDEALEAVAACPQPWIAAVHGPAIGGGLVLAMAADFCLASVQATFSLPEVKLSIFPALNLVPRLERRVGLTAARRLLLLGETISAEEAQRIGLIDRAVPPESLLVEVERLATRLAVLPATALRRTKAAFAAVQEPGYDQWEADQVRACWSSPERAAALAQFLSRD